MVDGALPSLLSERPIPIEEELSQLAVPGPAAAVAVEETDHLPPVPPRDDALSHPVEDLGVGHDEATGIIPEDSYLNLPQALRWARRSLRELLSRDSAT